jgi:hypothetical protein
LATGGGLIHPAGGKTTELSGGEPRSANNRMELTAQRAARRRGGNSQATAVPA